MKLRIRHRTTYEYGAAVTTSHHEACITPRDSEHQRTLFHKIDITPVPGVRRRRSDYFGNRTLYFSLSEPHRSLHVIAESMVAVTSKPVENLSGTPAWESVVARLRNDRRRDVLDAYQMTFDSPFVTREPELREYARPSFVEGRPLLEAVHDLSGRIHADFKYDPRATEVSTPLAQVLEQKSGVCQDFAHLMVGCLRAYGLAARYVSGYLLTRPPPGKPRLVGADASHAWAAVWVPEQGWVDFDPTNDALPNNEHVTVAYGRDFADVTPLRGVILGGGKHTVKVCVDVEPVATPAPHGHS
jgi:transglutaminase-like putative cysteine protease